MSIARTLATRTASRLGGVKQVNPVASPPGTEAGWTRPWAGLGLSGYSRAKPWSLQEFAKAYGGAQDGVVWVYACASLRSQELASWAWHLETEDETEIEPQAIPDDLHSLMRAPSNPHRGAQPWVPLVTWNGFMEASVLDLDLVGTSYWLLDQTNTLGQPLHMLRLRPEYMKVVVDQLGRKLGYLYSLPGMGVAIPYTNEQVLRLAYHNPNDDNYGLGKVEAIQRLLGLDIGMLDHLTGFFQNGARISGILSTSVPMNDIQFQRMREQFLEEYAGQANQFKVLIAEQGLDFKPITQAPAGSGVADLIPMAKDQVLSSFGVPAPLLGGLMENANYKMEESQHILTRRCLPTATKVQEGATYQLVHRWDPNWQLKLESTSTEPLSVRIERAGNMVGKGASLNELRREQDLPALEDEMADVPLLDTNVIPWDQVGKATRTNGLVGTGTTLNEMRGTLGLDPIDEDWANVPLVPGTVARIDKVGQQAPGLPPGGGAPPALPPGDKPPPEAPATTPEGEPGAQPGTTPKPGEAPPEEVVLGVGSPTTKGITIPDFGEGYERMAGAKLASGASTALANQLLAAKADTLRTQTPKVATAMRQLFKAQRQRVIERLMRQAAASRASSQHGRVVKAAIDTGTLWDPGHEDDQLRAVYKPLVDAIGAKAISAVGSVLDMELDWELTSPYINAARDQLGALITRVNDTTRADIAAVVDEGMRRGYSITQIANGFSDEQYPGIAGVFDQASDARAETIARSETAMIYNAASNAGYREAGVGLVAVLDGEGDTDCADANGSTWTIDDAEANPIAHPNCVRSFVPIVAGADLGQPDITGGTGGELAVRTTDQDGLLDALAAKVAAHLGGDVADLVKAVDELRAAHAAQPPAPAPQQQPLELHVHQAPVTLHQGTTTIEAPAAPDVHVAPTPVQVDVHEGEQHHHIEIPAPQVVVQPAAAPKGFKFSYNEHNQPDGLVPIDEKEV